ncbi:hypothetical protein B9Z55_007655 [Caenorhabditis nigoni]|uniref:BTB domain-containing protein n=1 Tax=Caenorhabditis nigoni TaxID=1611254 RepID=A0A2G5VAW9_9PELO|nr:hypothetical protein B9Z55_007655 [Caenorhabditis nigoni]
MTTKKISYKSGQKTVSNTGGAPVLETGVKDGIRHEWSGRVDSSGQASFIWMFNWEDLRSEGVNRLVGTLIVRTFSGPYYSKRVAIDWTDTTHSVWATFASGYPSHNITFEYNLTAHAVELPPPEKISFDEMFVASDKTDVVLIVEGKKLNVNKTFLSIHSDYFSTLFSSNFKEGQMKEIEIKEVSYDDFGLLLAMFSPNPQFPHDHTVEKLLEMASCFQVSSVTRMVEHHLLNNSRIGYEKMI